jgi:hypothetical protein
MSYGTIQSRRYSRIIHHSFSKKVDLKRGIGLLLFLSPNRSSISINLSGQQLYISVEHTSGTKQNNIIGKMWTLSRLAAETRSIHGNEKYDWEHSLCLDSTAGENWPWPRGKVPGDQAVSGAQGLPGTQMHKAYMGHPSWDQRSVQKFQRGPPAQDTIGCEFLWNPPPYFSQAGHMSRYPTNRPQTLFLPQWMPHTTEKKHSFLDFLCSSRSMFIF